MSQMCKPELGEKRGNSSVNIRGFGEEKASRESEGFRDSEQRKASVVLRDVGRKLAEQGRVERRRVEKESAIGW